MNEAQRKVKDYLKGTISAPHWQIFGFEPKAGLVVYPAALHTEDDWGVGDFEGLSQMLDFCLLTGQRILQLLPINDAGHDVSPYSVISIFALDPQYISVKKLLATLQEKKIVFSSDFIVHLDKEKEKLKEEERVIFEEEIIQEKGGKEKLPHPRLEGKKDYIQIRKIKIKALKKIWSKAKDNPRIKKEVEEFKDKNDWLQDYALYRLWLEKNHFAPWEEWEADLKNPTQAVIQQLAEQNQEEINFWAFVQMIAHHQFISFYQEARIKGIKIVGDLPFLLNKTSVEVWRHRNLFRLDLAIGAPPDQFNDHGQNWGFPVYRWSKLKETNYNLWRKRLKLAAQFYDAFRIDHILGLFRLWVVSHQHPERKIWQELAINGFYFPQITLQARDFEKLGLEVKDLLKHDLIMKIPKKILDQEKGLREGYAIKWGFDQTLFFKNLSFSKKEQLRKLCTTYRDSRQQALWQKRGQELLKVMLETTFTFLIGEDLGDVPSCVRATMYEFGLPGLRVHRWEEKDLRHYSPISVATTSVHDAETLRGWWKRPRLEDIYKQVRRKFRNRRIAVLSAIGVTDPPDKISPDLYRQLLKSREKVSSLLEGIKIKDYKAVKNYLELPKDKDYFQNKLKIAQADKEKNRQSFWQKLGLKGKPEEILTPKTMKFLLKKIYQSNSLLVIIPLVDLLGLYGLTAFDPKEDRINTPGVISEKNWQGRYPLTVKELIRIFKEKSTITPDLSKAEEIKKMVKSSGRLKR